MGCTENRKSIADHLPRRNGSNIRFLIERPVSRHCRRLYGIRNEESPTPRPRPQRPYIRDRCNDAIEGVGHLDTLATHTTTDTAADMLNSQRSMGESGEVGVWILAGMRWRRATLAAVRRGKLQSQ